MVDVNGEEIWDDLENYNWFGFAPRMTVNGRVYTVHRLDLMLMIVLVVIVSTVIGIVSTYHIVNGRWERKYREINDLEYQTCLGTDGWKDRNGIEHKVCRCYSAADYEKILRYQSKFKYSTYTNLVIPVKGDYRKDMK